MANSDLDDSSSFDTRALLGAVFILGLFLGLFRLALTLEEHAVGEWAGFAFSMAFLGAACTGTFAFSADKPRLQHGLIAIVIGGVIGAMGSVVIFLLLLLVR